MHVRYPMTIRIEHRSSLISRNLDLWAYPNDVTLYFHRPDKPTDNFY
ncbi:putative transposase [Croceicoccus naphthovorans]|nr:putative transposase [Croceicoccus naphthovorans]